jgi:UDP-N-acetylglucosamine 2-epimerase (non-hydrolysing)
MKKIMTIVGTRPEIIKLSRVIPEFDKCSNHILVNTVQNFDHELNKIFFKELEIRQPDYLLNVADKTTARVIGNIIFKSDEIMVKEKPDAVLIYGDTNSCLSVISAKRNKIPIFHFEAGNRCFDQRVPEEINRKIVDHLSDINLPLTEHARRYLIREGINPETIIKTGSPMKEVLDYFKPKIVKSQILKKLKLTSNNYFVVSAHRDENIESKSNFNDLLESLYAVQENYSKKIIVSTHPRTMKKLKSNNLLKVNKNIIYLKPMGLFDYINLQKNAFCVISDSGTITEEASILNFPAIMIRNAHERPEGMDEGILIMSGLKKTNVIESIDLVKSLSTNNKDLKMPSDYDVDNYSKKIVKIVYSYIDYVQRTVWFNEN